MAGHARYTALLDVCVLYPLAMTDALMSLATAGFFAAKWTCKIETEWIRAIERQRSDLTGRLHIRRDNMREAIPDWEVAESAWSPVVHKLQLPDPDDRHVLTLALLVAQQTIGTPRYPYFLLCEKQKNEPAIPWAAGAGAMCPRSSIM